MAGLQLGATCVTDWKNIILIPCIILITEKYFRSALNCNKVNILDFHSGFFPLPVTGVAGF